MNGNSRLFVCALSLLLLGCPKDKFTSVADATNAPDSQTLTDTAETDVLVASDNAADTSGSPDITPDVPIADTSDAEAAGSDAKVYTYVPVDPCAEEPVAPAEGSTCVTVDELRCSDFQQAIVKSFNWQTESGAEWVQVCRRQHVLRCEASANGLVWKQHLAADLVSPESLNAAEAPKTDGIWCLNGKLGPTLEPGICKGVNDSFKACPASMWGKRRCSGVAVEACGTAELIDAMLPEVKQQWHKTPAKELGDNLPYCNLFGRGYAPEFCSQKRLACTFKNPKTGEISYPSVPGNCIPDNDTGAHCATTCAELGLENP